ncbi:hypothetical protein LUZ60_000625 [Juncus effusus]|nr:hypothetical protein LUZ60_000625 [Juncus effusus]
MDECDDNMIRAQAELYSQIFSFYKSMSIKCAVELGIPDAIHKYGRPMSLSELLTALSLPQNKNPHLHRLLRVLTHTGFFREQLISGSDEVAYHLTPLSKLVISKSGLFNLSPFVGIELDYALVKPSLYLSNWFMQEDGHVGPFEMTHGCDLWQMTSQDSKLNQLVNDGMACDSHLLMDVIVKKYGYVFQGIDSLVDVGGGTGTTATAISKNFPHVKCTVLDLPQVVENLQKDGIVKFIPGDMFSYVPPANAVLIKWTLHDWSDEECITILQKCKEAIPTKEEGGKVIIVDMVVGFSSDMASKELQLLFDLLMMTAVTGKERDETEWATIFEEAGFSSYKIFQISGIRSIIEVYP